MDGDTARITLNRPEARNALSIELSDMLVDAIQTIKKSTEIKFVVIKGAGDTFCAGDADQFAGIANFTDKGDLWKKRRELAKNFWAD